MIIFPSRIINKCIFQPAETNIATCKTSIRTLVMRWIQLLPCCGYAICTIPSSKTYHTLQYNCSTTRFSLRSNLEHCYYQCAKCHATGHPFWYIRVMYHGFKHGAWYGGIGYYAPRHGCTATIHSAATMLALWLTKHVTSFLGLPSVPPLYSAYHLSISFTYHFPFIPRCSL